MTPDLLATAAPHTNGAALPAPACARIPAGPTEVPGSGLYVLRETPTEKFVCTSRAVPDAAYELAKVRPTPPGWAWAADAPAPGQPAGTPCPTREGWRHITFRMVPTGGRS